MEHGWSMGSRIGVRLRGGLATAVLVVDGALADQSTTSFTGSGERALIALLRKVAAHSPGPVDSVAWELSGLLDPSAHAERVAALRLVPREPVSDVLGAHPSRMMQDLVGWRATVRGGHDLFGVELTPVDTDGAVHLARSAAKAGYSALAITGAGGVSCAEHERVVAERIRDAVRGLRLCLSHEFGGLGLVQREAATVLSAALQPRANELVGRCEKITAAAVRQGAAWFVSADGGRVSAERLRAFPVVGLQARRAAGVLGAALVSGSPTTGVVLADGATLLSAQVRDGLPHAAPDVLEVGGLRIAMPQAVITRLATDLDPPKTTAMKPEPTVVASLDGTGTTAVRRYAERFGRSTFALADKHDVVAIGCAATEPSAWLDLVMSAESPAELERVRALVEHRACNVVASAGARPGSERVVGSAAVPLSFLRSGSYRIVVRATGQLGGEP
jgi:hypothetical protein